MSTRLVCRWTICWCRPHTRLAVLFTHARSAAPYTDKYFKRRDQWTRLTYRRSRLRYGNWFTKSFSCGRGERQWTSTTSTHDTQFSVHSDSGWNDLPAALRNTKQSIHTCCRHLKPVFVLNIIGIWNIHSVYQTNRISKLSVDVSGYLAAQGLGTPHGSRHVLLEEQESCAIAKMTARCALYK